MPHWDPIEADFEVWYYRAKTSDFCQEGDIRKPTKQMVRDTIKALDEEEPNWREVMGDNSFSLVLMKRYPQLEKRRKDLTNR